MMNFKPEQRAFVCSFWCAMGYYRMPEELFEQLNSKMSDRLGDYSDHLVGKVRTADGKIIQIAQKD